MLGFDVSHAPQRSWPLRDGGAVAVAGRMVTSDVVLRRRTAVRAVGMAMLPYQVVVARLRDGSLEQVMPEVLGRPASLSLVYPERASLLPRVRAFVDHLVARADTLAADAGAG